MMGWIPGLRLSAVPPGPSGIPLKPESELPQVAKLLSWEQEPPELSDLAGT